MARVSGIRIGATVVAVVAALLLSDNVAAMNAERLLSKRTEAASHLETPPSVYLGGMPYLMALFNEEIPIVEIHTMDVEVPRLGLINASTTLRDVSIDPARVLTAELDGAQASTVSHSIVLDGVALGRLLGISDLSIFNPNNISPSGGSSAEAELTGTIPGDKDPTTVTVDLRLVGPMFHMRPNADDPRVVEAFSYELDTRRLPLPSQATKVSLNGGSISFEVQRRNVTLRDTSLSPLEIAGHFDPEGRAT